MPIRESGSRGGRYGSGRSGPYAGRRQEGGSGPRFGGRSEGRGGERFQEGRGPRMFRKKVCRFCEERAPGVDYKDMERLGKFLTEKGKILPQRISGNCTRHQRTLARAVKRARHAALVPFVLG